MPEQAEVVKTIFRMYREDNSLEDIQKYLLSCRISFPSGKTKWSRDVLNKLLNNGKYIKGIIDFEEYCEGLYKKETNKLFRLVCLFWSARRDSNPRPSESESAAISSFATSGYTLFIIAHFK